MSDNNKRWTEYKHCINRCPKRLDLLFLLEMFETFSLLIWHQQIFSDRNTQKEISVTGCKVHWRKLWRFWWLIRSRRIFVFNIPSNFCINWLVWSLLTGFSEQALFCQKFLAFLNRGLIFLIFMLARKHQTFMKIYKFPPPLRFW